MDSNKELNRKKGMTTKIINGSLPDDSLKQKLELLRQKCLQSRETHISHLALGSKHDQNLIPSAQEEVISKELKYNLTLSSQNSANKVDHVGTLTNTDSQPGYTYTVDDSKFSHLPQRSDNALLAAIDADDSFPSTNLIVSPMIGHEDKSADEFVSTAIVAEVVSTGDSDNIYNAASHQSMESDGIGSSSREILTNDFDFFGLSSSQEIDYSEHQNLAEVPSSHFDYSENNIENSHHTSMNSYEFGPEKDLSHELDYSHYSIESKFEYDPYGPENTYEEYPQSQYTQYDDETAVYDKYDYNQYGQGYDNQEQQLDTTPHHNPEWENSYNNNNNDDEDYATAKFSMDTSYKEPDMPIPPEPDIQNYDNSYNSFDRIIEDTNYANNATNFKSEVVARPTKKLANILLASSSVDQTTESEDEAKKKRHLQIWGKFFENASAAYSNNIEISSDSDGPRTVKPNSKLVDYQSVVGKNYFTLAIAMEQSWPVLISSKKYLSLMSLAKASVGAGDFTIPHMAMFAAIIKEDNEALNTFFMRGSNPNAADIHGRNLSHHAARVGNVEILAMLVDNDCDMDRQDNEGYTPLHIAILFNRLSVVRFLLDCAVDVRKCNRDGENAVSIAKRTNHFECLQLLEDFLMYSTLSSKDIPDNSTNEDASPSFLVSPDSSPMRKSNRDNLNTNDTVDNLRKRALLNRKVDFHISPVRHSPVTTYSVDKRSAEVFEEKFAEVSSIDAIESISKNSDVEEDETDEMRRESTNNFVDTVAAYIWSFAITLINLSILLLTGSRPTVRKLKASSGDDQNEDKVDKLWKNSDAPPTDQELTQIGLGFSSSKVTPPNDVQVAIAMSKAGRKLIESPQAFSSSPATNNYSLGQQLPQGVSWRYVNILDSNDGKEQR